MTCPECQTSWCYFCGLKESDCDKAEATISSNESEAAISRHNFDWESNPKRSVCLIKNNIHRIKSLLVVQCI